MSSPLTIPVLTAFNLTWTLTDTAGNPINDAVMTATLYAGRSLRNPTSVPGTPVLPIVNVTLNYVVASAGQYQAAIPGTINPPPDGTGYVLVIDASVASQQVYHAEQPITIETAGSLMDLTTVDLVKAWYPGLKPGVASADDPLLQSCITAWGFEFLRRTGLGDQGGNFTQSPFNSICTWNETYDGSGTRRLMLRNRPVQSVLSLSINGQNVPQSTSYPAPGFVLDGSRRSLSLRGAVAPFGGGPIYSSWQAGPFRVFGGGMRFWEGSQNISVSYTAGYNDTPADIVVCANMVVALNYKRRSYIGEISRSVAGGGGSITFGNWDIPPECARIVDMYTRTL